MNTLRTRFTVPVAIALTLAVAPALAGCFGNPIEQVVEGATGGDVDLGGASVPDGFPAEVPLTPGEVLYGASVGGADGRIWNVTIKVANAGAIDEIVAQLEGAGFTTPVEGLGNLGNGAAEIGSAVLENANYSVLVVVTSRDGDADFVANYTVTEKTP